MVKRKIYNDITSIHDTFNINDVEQLINKCNYTPYYDNPHTDDLIQFAAYTNDNKLIGFISCVTPEFLYNDSSFNKLQKNIEIEITAMVDPEFRGQKVFSSLLKELKLYISLCCEQADIQLPRIKYIVAGKKCLEKNICSSAFKYSHSEYLMSLTPLDSKQKGFISGDINKNILNKKYIVDKYDDMYRLINTRNDTVITSISYSAYDSSICIHDVFTMPYYRHTGCAKYLLSVMIHELSKNDNMTKSFILHVSGRNPAAVNLYNGLGFMITEEIKYYALV